MVRPAPSPDYQRGQAAKEEQKTTDRFAREKYENRVDGWNLATKEEKVAEYLAAAQKAKGSGETELYVTPTGNLEIPQGVLDGITEFIKSRAEKIIGYQDKHGVYHEGSAVDKMDIDKAVKRLVVDYVMGARDVKEEALESVEEKWNEFDEPAPPGQEYAA